MKIAFPIYVCWDEDVDGYVLEGALDGLFDIINLVPGNVDVRLHGPGPWGEGDFSSARWYIDQCLLNNRQVNANRLLELLQDEPWQAEEEHLDLFITSRDITARDSRGQFFNFLFGLTRAGLGSVVSFHRFGRDGSDSEMALAAMRLLTRHEFGHVLGLVGSNATNSDPRADLYRGHCLNACTMRQVVSVPEAEHMVRSLDRDKLFCDNCATYLARDL